MPYEIEHINLANDNEKFYQFLEKSNPDWFNWSIIVIFYMAVHYVDSFLSKNKIEEKFKHPITHTNRNTAFGRACNDSVTVKAYFFLYNESKNARYEPHLSLHYKIDDVKRCAQKLNEIKCTLKIK